MVRLMKLTLCSLSLSLLLSTLETTIVSTSLVSIGDALHRFDQSGWVVTSYLLTYTGAPFSVLLTTYSLKLTGGNRLSDHLCQVQRHLRSEAHAAHCPCAVHRLLDCLWVGQ